MKKTFTRLLMTGFLALQFFTGNAQENVNFNMQFPNDCDPVPVHFVNNSSMTYYMGPVEYKWVINSDTVFIGNVLPDSTFNMGSYDIYLYAYDTLGAQLGYGYNYLFVEDCSTIDRVDFFMNFAGNCAPLNVGFTNTSFYNNYLGPVSYKWVINGDTISEDVVPMDTTLDMGSYSVELYAYDTNDYMIDYNYKYLDVWDCSGGENISFYINQMGYCSGDLLSFINTSYMNYYTGDVTYIWNINGNSINRFEILDTTLAGGNYHINLDAYDTNGFHLGSYYQDFNMDGVMDNFRTSFGDEACPGEPLNFWYEGNYMDLNWDMGDGKMYFGQQYINHSYPNMGIYKVKLMVNTYDCGSDSIVRMIDVSNTAVPEVHAFSERGNLFCPFDEIIFNVEGQFPNIEWTFEDGSKFYQPKVSYAFGDTGIHMAVVKATNMCGGVGYDTIYVEVRNNLPVYGGFSWWHEGPSPCPMTPIQFEPYNSGNFVWDFGDGASSTLEKPMHAYTGEGVYNVQLVTRNGCGFADTSYNEVYIQYSKSEFYIDFDVKKEMDNDIENFDTLRVCPGEAVRMEVWYSAGDITYNWDFGDGIFSNVKSPVHAYTMAGLKTITLRAENSCKDTAIAVRYVMVDATIMPVTNLMSIPTIVCPGDEVLFFDMESNPERNNYTYNIDFGDGTFTNNITIPDDPKINTLAEHVYNTLGTYNYIFTATNQCNNTDTVLGQVIVDSNPGNLPFYHVKNTTSDALDDKKEVDDWTGLAPGPNTHQFVIPVQWSAWIPGMDNNFFVYFWYGEFDPESEDDDGPAGMASFTSSTINSGDSIVVNIPVKITEFQSIGIAAVWYCDAAFAGEDPEVFGMPVDGGLNPINSFPLIPGSRTDLRNVTAGNILLDMGNEWDGNCRSNKPNGEWKSPTGNGMAYILSLWQDNMGTGNYYIDYKPEFNDPNGTIGSENISWGTYNYMGDTLVLIPYETDCYINGNYTFMFYGDSVIFNLASDTCTKRIDAMTNGMFYRYYDNGDDYRHYYAGCPGDSVEFTVVGGESYIWNFGDGTILNTTQRYVKYAYADTGLYNAFVVITNSCGRTDTIPSPVLIGDNNVPMANFYWEPWDPKVGDTVYFRYEGWDPTGSFTYTWMFGDGSPSANGPEAKHVYNLGGEFNVRLTVKNGCGENVQNQHIWIKGGLNNCEIEARFIPEIFSDTVNFINNSFGNITNASWDFGDGTYSNEMNPTHVYGQTGVYQVCLTVIDATTQCQNSICKEIWIGNVQCFADFVFSTISTTNTVILNDKSLNATNWYWDFGDGYSSNMKDPTHAYPVPGRYPIKLQITNGDQSCFSEKFIEVEVGFLDSTFCFPEFGFFIEDSTVTFTDQSSGNISKWYWDFGDGTTSNKQFVVHKYQEPSVYTVCLSIEDTVNNCMKQVCKEIKVGVIECLAKYSFIVDPTTLNVTFTDKSLGGIDDWLWDFGDGNLSILQNPKYKYTNTGVYPVILKVKNSATGCFSETKQNIVVGKVQDCYADYSFFIDGMTVKFNDKSLGNINSRYWDFGNGTFGYTANPLITYKKTGIKKVCYLVEDTTTGCQSQICKEIKVGEVNCASEFTYFIDQGTKQVDFFENSTGAVDNWLWDFGNGTVSFDTNSSVAYNDYGVYNVCLTVSENVTNGCVSKLCKEVTVKDTSSTAVLCNTKFTYVVKEGTRSVTFNDATATKVTSWFWDLGDGTFSKDTMIKHTYGSDGIYDVCLSTFNTETGCYSETCKAVTVKTTNDSIEALDAEFTYMPDASSSVVKFVDQSTGNPTNWYWTFGDGSYTKGVDEISHDYEKTGKFMVCLYIFDATTGNTSEECKTVPVGEATCSVTAGFGKFIDPDTRTVNFSNKSTGSATKWFWSFGDGSSSTLKNPEHIYAKDGLYLVSLSARDETGNCADYVADFIQVGSLDCQSDFTYTVDADSNKLTLTSTSKGSVEKYFWSFDDGTSGKGSSITHKYKSPGMYTVSLAINTAGGTCTDYKREPIQVGTVDCNSDFSVYVDPETNKAYFTNEVIGNSTRLLWQFGDGGMSIAENPEHTYKAQGYFTVGLNTYDPDNNCMDYKEELILIGEKGSDCEADFFYQTDGKTVDFIDKSIGDDLSYFWWMGDGATTSREADTTVTYAEGGYYLVCLTVTTASNIQNTRCKHIAVDPPTREDCLAQFIYTVDPASSTVNFTDKSLGEPNKWLWRFGDGQEAIDQQNPSHTYTEAGFYKVRMVSGNTTTGCKSSEWQMINVSMASDGLKAGFGYEIDSLDLKAGGYPVDFVGVSAGKPAKYSWDFGDGSSSTATTSPSHTYSSPGDYNVCLTIEDQVTGESDMSCESVNIEDTTSVNIKHEIQQSFVEFSSFPNPFMEYTNITFGLPAETGVNISIYDQSGRLVYTLVNTTKEAGKHKMTWDASHVAKGLYYIQLSTTEGVVKTRMVVKR